MAYEVTATKKRPQTLNELIDQEFVVATLQSSIRQSRIAHAYIFSGPRGVGKTSAARILAKALNCENGPTPEPCGVCSNCLEITKGRALDVIEIDGASNTSVNDVREIKDEVLFAPNICPYKVYIIDEVHMLSNSAFNALLKTIEEPPPYVVFIFATTEIHKVPATIRSRCQQFNFKLISITKIKDTLTKLVGEMGIEAEDKALFWVAKESTGSLRDAFTLFDQVVSFSENNITLDKIREKLGIVGIDEMNELIELLADGKPKEALEYVADVLSKGIAVEQFVIELAEYFRNILFIKHGILKDHILGYPAETFSPKVKEAYSVPQLEKAVELLLDLYKNFRYSINQKFELELLISRLSLLKKMISQAEILKRIREIKRDIQNTNFVAEAAPPGKNTIVSQENATHLNKVEINEVSGSTETPSNPEAPVNTNEIPDNLLERAIAELHNMKLLTLASAMEKIDSWTVENKILFLNFNIKDKFSGEKIKREKRSIQDALKSIINLPLAVKITFVESSNNNDPAKDDRVEILKNMFNGEVIKGE